MGCVNTDVFDKADYLKKEEADDGITNLRKLVGIVIDTLVVFS